MKKTISLIICLIIAFGSVAIGINSLSAGAYSSWQEGYRSYLLDLAKKYSPASGNSFELAFIDSDSVPELVVTDGPSAHGYGFTVLVYKNGEVIESKYLGTNDFWYYPNKGIYRHSGSGGAFSGGKDFYRLEGTQSVLIDECLYEYSEEYPETPKYTINGVEVTEKKYNSIDESYAEKYGQEKHFSGTPLTEENINDIFSDKEQKLKDFIINGDYIELITPDGGSTGGYIEPEHSFNVYDFDGDEELELIIQTHDFHVNITSVFKVVNNRVEMIAGEGLYKSSYSYLVKGDKYHGFVCPAMHQSYGPGICSYFSMDGVKTAFQREYDSKGNLIGYNFDDADEIDDELLDLLMDEDEALNNDNLVPLYFYSKDEIEAVGWDEFFNPTWSRAYYDFYESGEYTENFVAGENLSDRGNDSNGPKFGLKDLNNDGIPELLVGDPWESGTNGHGYIYTYKNNKVEYIGYSGSYGGVWSPHAISSKNYPGVFTYIWERENGYPNEMPFHIMYYEYDGTRINTIDVCADYSKAGEYERITDNIGLYNAIVNEQETDFDLTYLKDIFYYISYNVNSIEWGGFIAKYSKYFLVKENTDVSTASDDIGYDDDDLDDLNQNDSYPQTIVKENTVYTKNINNNPNGEETKMTFPYSLEHYIYQTSSTEYNPSLASILSWFAYSAYLDEGTFVWNKSERTHIEKTYMSFGFDELQSYRYNISAMDSKDCAYSIAKKKLDGEKSLVMITVRGTGNDFSEGIRGEWLGDFTISNWGTAVGMGWHPNFEKCAHDVFNSIKDKNWLDTSGNTIYCLTGHSKGAAVANLTSVLLEQNGVAKENVYDYNFACPDVAVDYHFNWNNMGNHSNMFNINNVSDMVPYIPAIIGNHLLATGALNTATHWGKYGISKWFSLNWNDAGCTNIMSFISNATGNGGIPCKYVNDVWKTKIIEDYLNPHDPRIYLTFCRYELGLNDMLDREIAVNISGTKLLENELKSILAKITMAGQEITLETIVLLIRCPVDFEIKDSNGNLIAKCIDNKPTYYDVENNYVLIFVDGDRKAVLIANPADVTVEITATDTGTMEFEADHLYNFFNQQDDNAKSVENISLTDGKRFKFTVNDLTNLDNNELYVNNKGVNEFIVEDDGTETRVISTSKAKLNVPLNTEVKYAATVTVKARATGVPDGYYVALFDGGTLLAKGSNTEVSYTFPGEFTGSKNITAKVIDDLGNVQKDANGDDLSTSFEVKVKSGFFAKLIAFFKRLFRVLPKITVEP